MVRLYPKKALRALVGRDVRRADANLMLRGLYEWEHVRDGRVIADWVSENIVVIQGNNHMFDVEFHGEVQVLAWYIGLYEGVTDPVAGDTLASHGYTEYTNYTGDRKEWVEGPASNRVIETAAPANRAEFDFIETATMEGGILCSVPSGAVGILFSGSPFTIPRTMNNGDTLRVSYKLTGSSS